MKKIKFSDLEFKPNICDGINIGIYCKIFFDNGFGASIIKTKYSYGGEKGLYEIAVLKGNAEKFDLCYTTEITDDVLGYLTEAEVEKYVNEIKNLKQND